MAITTGKLSQITRWRSDFLKAMDGLRDDSPPENWSDVFVPESHYKALHPQTMLVEGMRGAGKSFWTKVLSNNELRLALSRTDTDLRLKTELQQLNTCKGIFWDQSGQQDLPHKTSVKRWLLDPDFEPSLFWAAITLAQFSIDKEWGFPSKDLNDPWTKRVSWAQENPELVMRALKSLDAKFAASNAPALVVVDGLDVVSSRFADTQLLMRGLFQLLLDFRYAKGLRFKIFVREDILNSAAATVSDASKLLNEKVTLQWTQQDLFGLAFHFLGQRSSLFRTRFSNSSKKNWRNENERWIHSEILSGEAQQALWIALAGPYMGNAATKGHSYPWIFKHLADGKGRVSPRTFLKAIKKSIEATIEKYAGHSHVIHYEAIRDGVRHASGDRVNELDNEYQWVNDALRVIAIKRKTVPIDWDELVKLWSENKSIHKDVISRIESKNQGVLIPWEIDDPWENKTYVLRDTMSEIGVVQLRERQGVLRIDLPDIYRLGYQVGRYGGISVRKR